MFPNLQQRRSTDMAFRVMDSIPFVDLKAQYQRIRPRLMARIEAVLEGCNFINGPEVDAFERELAGFCGSPHAVGVASGTDALLMVIMAEGVGPGDAVFVPAFTFTATAEVVLLAGATPVFVDVDDRTFNLHPGDLEVRVQQAARRGKLRPRMVIAADLFGQPADYPAIARVAERHGLFVLADAAQSFGARLGGRSVGTVAPATATSFFPAKPLGCYGDGGAILLADGGRADVLRSIRSHGKGHGKYDIVRIGLNARLDTLQAAILLAKLEVFADELATRRTVADRYDARLSDHATLPFRAPGAESSWAQYSILLDRRDTVAERLRRDGIPTAIYYPRPMHLQPAYVAYGEGEGSLPTSEALSKRILSLPMHPYLAADQIDRIAEAVIRAAAA